MCESIRVKENRDLGIRAGSLHVSFSLCAPSVVDYHFGSFQPEFFMLPTSMGNLGLQ